MVFVGQKKKLYQVMTKFLFNIESEVLKQIRKEVAPYGGTVSGFIRKLIHDYFKNK